MFGVIEDVCACGESKGHGVGGMGTGYMGHWLAFEGKGVKQDLTRYPRLTIFLPLSPPTACWDYSCADHYACMGHWSSVGLSSVISGGGFEKHT